MAFKDYVELVDPLRLPIKGKVYTIPPLGMEDGIRFNLSVDPKSDAPPIPDDEFVRMFLGTAYEEMLADNVPGSAPLRAAMTALADWQRGREVAEIMWETGADPKALTAMVKKAARGRPQDHKPKGSKRSKHTGKASSTLSPAPTSGTTSPAPSSPLAENLSPGSTSSSSGPDLSSTSTGSSAST